MSDVDAEEDAVAKDPEFFVLLIIVVDRCCWSLGESAGGGVLTIL